MELRVKINETGIPDGVVDMIQELPPAEQLTTEDTDIVLDFEPRFVYRTGLVLLSTWRKSLPKDVNVRIDDTQVQESTRRLFTNSGFRDIIESEADRPRVMSHSHGKVPLQPVVRGYSTESAIGEICNILGDYAGMLHDPGAFKIMLSELCENTFAHSEFEAPGYICANFDEHSRKCEIAIADSGIGIKASYLEGTNTEAISRIKSGTCPIDIALDGWSSSKPIPGPGNYQAHYGLGLFIVRRLIEENRGRLVVISDSDCLVIERFQKRTLNLTRGWRGTFVGMVIDMLNPLPLESIYEEAESAVIPTAGGNFPPSEETRQAETQAEGDRLKNATQPFREICLAQYGSQLLTREVGVAIRADLGTALASGSKVKVVLDDIDDITPSVADECFGKLAESMGKSEFEARIILAGGQRLVSRLIEFVVSRRLKH